MNGLQSLLCTKLPAGSIGSVREIAKNYTVNLEKDRESAGAIKFDPYTINHATIATYDLSYATAQKLSETAIDVAEINKKLNLLCQKLDIKA